MSAIETILKRARVYGLYRTSRAMLDQADMQFAALDADSRLLGRHPRAEKLLDRGEPFLVIAEHEPYYLKAYSMIRDQEIKQGTWSEEDERIFKEAWERKSASKAATADLEEE